MLQIYFDAARRPDTGQSAAGCLIINQGQQRQEKTTLPKTNSNHDAEFLAAIWALQLVSAEGNLQLYSDSKIVVEALQKQYAKHFQAYVDRIQPLLDAYSLAFINWVPEKNNLGAHNLAQQALKKADA
ncbi:ribonuclease HI family protein [Eupransor demetentiae]|uniref:Ribonuclease HI (RnhA) n=1 Tax=Eupransor demetentiae TaxID=3109584 RepID=A0ABM9N4K7_9LACO|nr:Ribonuclease HI (RnhA) [Lactobacillaceae bacterium LMG 33000]